MSKALSLLAEATATLRISPSAAKVYRSNAPRLTALVNENLRNRPDINKLTGGNPLSMMRDNHRHHAIFMSTVFELNNYALLSKILPWVYRAYANHGFDFDYFKVELEAWMDAARACLPPGHADEVIAIYAWMLEKHATVIALSKTSDTLLPEPAVDNRFMAALLEGCHRDCLAIADQCLREGNSIEHLYINVIRPSMRRIGELWERGEISVAQEHLASAIVARVMSQTVSERVDGGLRGRVVVTAAPNEYHEIGAWMLADILDGDGWDTRYLGANTPVIDLLDMLRVFEPFALAISVTMPFNIIQAKEAVEAVKSDLDIGGIKILVGGGAFEGDDSLWRATGADGFASDPREAKKILREWARHE